VFALAALSLSLLVLGAASLALLLLARERRAVTLNEWEWGLLYRDGRFEKVLQAGRYRFWPLDRRYAVHRLARHQQTLSSAPIELISEDRFVFRAIFAIAYRITEPRLAFENPLAVRVALAIGSAAADFAATRSLGDFLSQRAQAGALISERLAAAFPEIEIASVAMSTLMLPPEVRRMFTDVERAKMEGLAALERARSEQAALRSLANAARLLRDNPELMRLRTLQALSPAGKGATLVLGADAIVPTQRPD